MLIVMGSSGFAIKPKAITLSKQTALVMHLAISVTVGDKEGFEFHVGGLA